MQYNTTNFTNIDGEDFVGVWVGEDYLIKAGEIRYFPSFLSEHFAKHLTDKLYTRLPIEQRKDRLKFGEEMRSKILGKEMETKSIDISTSFSREVAEHEQAVLDMLALEDKEQKIKRIEALKIAKKNV